MSASDQTTNPSTSNFNVIFEAALNEYEILTGQDLRTYPFFVALESFNSPDAILNVFRTQTQAFDKVRKNNKKLIDLLAPIVEILFEFSAALGEGVDVVSLRFFLYYSPTTSFFFTPFSHPIRSNIKLPALCIMCTAREAFWLIRYI